MQDIAQIYERNAKTVYRVCYIYVKNPHDAEDMSQSVFVKLMGFLADKTVALAFKSEEHEKAWLIRISANVCKDFLKSSWAKRTEIPDTLPARDVFGEREENNDVLEKVLALPEKYKIAIYLFYYEGYSTAEIARMTKKHESTVRGILHRGRKMLKLELSENYSKTCKEDLSHGEKRFTGGV